MGGGRDEVGSLNDESTAPCTDDLRISHSEKPSFGFRHSSFVRHSSFGIRHSLPKGGLRVVRYKKPENRAVPASPAILPGMGVA